MATYLDTRKYRAADLENNMLMNVPPIDLAKICPTNMELQRKCSDPHFQAQYREKWEPIIWQEIEPIFTRYEKLIREIQAQADELRDLDLSEEEKIAQVEPIMDEIELQEKALVPLLAREAMMGSTQLMEKLNSIHQENQYSVYTLAHSSIFDAALDNPYWASDEYIVFLVEHLGSDYLAVVSALQHGRVDLAQRLIEETDPEAQKTLLQYVYAKAPEYWDDVLARVRPSLIRYIGSRAFGNFAFFHLNKHNQTLFDQLKTKYPGSYSRIMYGILVVARLLNHTPRVVEDDNALLLETDDPEYLLKYAIQHKMYDFIPVLDAHARDNSIAASYYRKYRTLSQDDYRERFRRQ